jgi:hypothetical protein
MTTFEEQLEAIVDQIEAIVDRVGLGNMFSALEISAKPRPTRPAGRTRQALITGRD